MIRCLGIGETDASLDFQVSRDSQEKVDAFLRSRGLEGKRTAGVCPAGSWPAKTWPLEKFAAFADRITKELGCAVVILWGPGEEVLAERMASLMKTQGLVACRTDIEEAGALLRRCELFVSNDSGLKHIAVAVGTATVTIFGPTNPITWNPPDPRHRAVHTDADCLFCDRNECDSMVCMENLEVSDVLSVSKEVLRLDRESSTI
jgi:heptosyltransferase-2